MEQSALPLLTLEILEANHHNNWEAALTYPLPAEPSLDLIEMAIDEIINGLSFVTVQVAQIDPASAKRDIERAAARLVELTDAKAKAYAAWVQECDRERLLEKFHSDTQH